ncbi:hypothetical protein NN3_56460 [Nocardia neocaledoniensis NBRC 108232]|uniref:Uncharacterized protein n=1 Tax=Nocardia neocaledoniensis TaxID=236511 RepID=A0A317N9I8_9NOCA|nr:hypothetical protein [Nocardia neocaledoniensis]PWV71714.1 hypothetical protein DFR69_110198 [Nocardia neocaledoniensis]GEM34639.1 hypothetical protein NN3_56460 [Nocardia neocaledoniensis NBRC 108232]
MRNTLGLASCLAAAALVATAPTATAGPAPAPVADTGSAAVDLGSTAANSIVQLARDGDIIGVIVLLGITPLHMLTSGICDLATLSALPDPCSSGTTRYQAASEYTG